MTFPEWWEILSDDDRRTKPKFWLSSDAWDDCRTIKEVDAIKRGGTQS